MISKLIWIKEKMLHSKYVHWKVITKYYLIQIVGHYLFLAASIKGTKQRIKEIVKEITRLWQQNLNFSHIVFQVVQLGTINSGRNSWFETL